MRILRRLYFLLALLSMPLAEAAKGGNFNIEVTGMIGSRSNPRVILSIYEVGKTEAITHVTLQKNQSFLGLAIVDADPKLNRVVFQHRQSKKANQSVRVGQGFLTSLERDQSPASDEEQGAYSLQFKDRENFNNVEYLPTEVLLQRNRQRHSSNTDDHPILAVDFKSDHEFYNSELLLSCSNTSKNSFLKAKVDAWKADQQKKGLMIYPVIVNDEEFENDPHIVSMKKSAEGGPSAAGSAAVLETVRAYREQIKKEAERDKNGYYASEDLNKEFPVESLLIASKTIAAIDSYIQPSLPRTFRCRAAGGKEGICCDQECRPRQSPATLSKNQKACQMQDECGLPAVSQQPMNGTACKAYVAAIKDDDRIVMLRTSEPKEFEEELQGYKPEEYQRKTFDGACHSGTCIPCAQSAPVNPCLSPVADAVFDPASNQLGCSPFQFLPNGTACGNEQVCQFGVCRSLESASASDLQDGNPCTLRDHDGGILLDQQGKKQRGVVLNGRCYECDKHSRNKLKGVGDCSAHPAFPDVKAYRKSCGEPNICIYDGGFQEATEQSKSPQDHQSP